MQTQILQRPVYVDEHHRATLCCPGCGKTKIANVAKYQDAPVPPKVKCACGHYFRVPIASQISSRYRCQQCDGQGYRTIKAGKKVTISELGYHYHTLQSKEPCEACGGLGIHYPSAAHVGCISMLYTALACLAAHTLDHIDWMAGQLGVHGPTMRAWLEMDVYDLCHMDINDLCIRRPKAGVEH